MEELTFVKEDLSMRKDVLTRGLIQQSSQSRKCLVSRRDDR